MPQAVAVMRGALLAMALLVAGCAPNAPARPDTHACRAGDCAASSLEVHDDAAAPFALGYVEFDDQGRGFDGGQETALFDHMARQAALSPLAIVVFVHGWQHSARADDGNVGQFRTLLQTVAAFEARQPAARRRAVVGVYVGWRGRSAELPGIDKLTFWTRKDTAHRVADGSVRSLLGKLRAFRDLVNLRDAAGGQPRHETRMLTIGHSFGGLIVYSALAQYYTDRAASSLINAQYFANRKIATDHRVEKHDNREISAYGDLVITVNPAYEAMRYEPIRQLVDEAQTGVLPERFAPRQGPVLVQITSVGDTKLEGDWATGLAFPLGRRLNTFLQATRTDPRTHDDERAQIEQAVGHYEPFWTHDLDLPGGRTAASPAAYDPAAACRAFLAFERDARGPDGRLKPGWVRHFMSGTVLTEIGHGHFDPTNPFWIVRAHPDLILDHNDIMEPAFVDFVAQLYGDVDRLEYPELCSPT